MAWDDSVLAVPDSVTPRARGIYVAVAKAKYDIFSMAFPGPSSDIACIIPRTIAGRVVLQDNWNLYKAIVAQMEDLQSVDYVQGGGLVTLIVI